MTLWEINKRKGNYQCWVFNEQEKVYETISSLFEYKFVKLLLRTGFLCEFDL